MRSNLFNINLGSRVSYFVQILVLASLILSCKTPEQRVARLIDKYNLEKVDTTKIYDTIRLTTERVEIDTVRSLQSISKDTFIIHKENIKFKTIYSYHTDSIYFFVEKEPETLDTALVITQITKSVKLTPYFKLPKWIQWMLALIVLILVVLIVWNNVIKKWL